MSFVSSVFTAGKKKDASSLLHYFPRKQMGDKFYDLNILAFFAQRGAAAASSTTLLHSPNGRQMLAAE